MIITCSDGMGYIYLKPPRFDYDDSTHNQISNYVQPNRISIPYVTHNNVAPLLNQMRMAANTFKVDCGTTIDTQFGSDLDEDGYLEGIELTLPEERFIDLVNNQAFKVIQTDWREHAYRLITLDHMENVFNSNNVIYKLTDAEDALVIVHITSPDSFPIVLFKGFLSARDDLYPIEYLLKPQFVVT